MTEVITQRRLRNDSGEILRGAAAGEVFRVGAGESAVEVRRAAPDLFAELTAAGLLSPGSDDDFADFPEPAVGIEPIDASVDAVRSDR